MSETQSSTIFECTSFIFKINRSHYSDSKIILSFLPIKMNWFRHSTLNFYNGKINFWFWVCSSNILVTLWQHWKRNNLSTLVQRCVNVGTLVGPQCSHNIQAALSQCCGNIESYVIFLHCRNVVITLAECCLVRFQLLAPTFTQHCLNSVGTLWYDIVFNVVPTLWQHCNIGWFSIMWKHCYNLIPILWPHCYTVVI